MLNNEELLYSSHDNTVNLILYSNSSAYDLSATTRAALAIRNTTIVLSSTDSSSGVIKWTGAGFATGEVRISMSTQLTPGRYSASLIVYAPTFSSGIVWDDNIPLRVKADPV